MSIHSKLLETLRCPVTKRPLRVLSQSQLDRLNQAISDGLKSAQADGAPVCYADGRVVGEPLDSGLITDNASAVYRVNDGIPVMFEDDSIPVAQLGELLANP